MSHNVALYVVDAFPPNDVPPLNTAGPLTTQAGGSGVTEQLGAAAACVLAEDDRYDSHVAGVR